MSLGPCFLFIPFLLGFLLYKMHDLPAFLRMRTLSPVANDCRLLGLPLETLLDILSHLEWNDILRVRQTCWHLHRVSQARAVWLALIKRYSTIQPRPLWPEKPLQMHAASGLEHLILRWQSTKVGWLMQESSKVIPSKRRFATYDKRSRCVYLVEGGRFLLVGNKSGAVHYYDLSAHVITPSMLVPEPEPSDEEVEGMKISVDVDFDVEFLSFRLGILTQSKLHPYDPNGASLSIRRIQVWQVTSSIDENGLVNGLSPERKASFLEEYQAICFAFRLQGSYVLYSLFYPPTQGSLYSSGHRTVIVNWRLPDSTSLLYSRQIVPHANATWLALLPNNRLLCHTNFQFRLYDLSTTPTTCNLPSQNPQEKSNNFTAIPFVCYALSHPFFLRNSTRLTILTSDGVKGLIIPNMSNEFTFVDLFSGEFYTDSGYLGYTLAFFVHLWPEFIVVQFSWPDDNFSINSMFKRCLENGEFGEFTSTSIFAISIDLSSGRIVISDRTTPNQLVLDTALI